VQQHTGDLKKPLKVKFVGEEGVDEGGVQKEFFQLIMRDIVDAKFGMFTYNETTRSFWFSASPIDMPLEFELVGTVLGLAIYNAHILDISFPFVVYKKLLGKKTCLDDLAGVDPDLHRGLKGLLAFQGNVEEVYSWCFEASYTDVFGSPTTVPLKDGGENLPVTNSNREEFVELLVDVSTGLRVWSLRFGGLVFLELLVDVSTGLRVWSLRFGGLVFLELLVEFVQGLA
ncbi:unnamed protein product, partial [Closterium sp. NIES-54]